MDKKSLECFVAIAETGSITAAARRMYMAQPPLSTRMKRLEEELGCLLFIRGSRKISLTEAGKAFYKRAVGILEMYRIAAEEAQSTVSMAGVVRIGIVSSVVSTYFPAWIHGFVKKNPDIRYEITEANTYELLEKLRSGLLHFAIIRTPFTAENMVSIPLCLETLVALGRKISGEITMAQLSRLPLVIYRRWEHIIRSAFAEKNLSPTFLCICESALTAIKVAAATDSVALVPQSAHMLAPNDIELRVIPDMEVTSKICLVHQSGAYISSSAQKMITYISSLAEI